MSTEFLTIYILIFLYVLQHNSLGQMPIGFDIQGTLTYYSNSGMRMSSILLYTHVLKKKKKHFQIQHFFLELDISVAEYQLSLNITDSEQKP